MAADDIAAAQLETINLSSAGHFSVAENATTQIEPQLFSSADAMLSETDRLRMGDDPLELQKGFLPAGEVYSLAVHISGKATTAFPKGIRGADKSLQLTSTERLAVTLVADTDLLSDRLWVQVQNFFGRRLASPWAENGELIANLADYLTGSSDLISLYARGRYSRPFTKVEKLRRQAEQRFLASEQRLQQELADLDEQLAGLQQQEEDSSGLTSLPLQQHAVEDLRQEKLQLRQKLREVQYDLDKDINALGDRLKLMNIFVFPIVFTLLCGFVAWMVRRRQHL